MKKNTTGFLIEVTIAIALGLGIAVVLLFDTTGKSGSGLGREYDYTIEDLMKVDPALINYTQVDDVIKVGFDHARSLAVDHSGGIYVAGDTSVRILRNGTLRMELPLDAEARCIAVRDNRIYVGHGDRVDVFDLTGERIRRFAPLGARAVLTSIAVGGNDVFVADAGNRVVYRYSKEGELLKRIGEKDAERKIDGFLIPSPYFDLAIGDDGLLRVVNPGRRRIEAYTFEGDLEFSWGNAGNTEIEDFCGCCNPVNFAILSNGRFVTCEKGLPRVKIYDPEGAFLSVVAGPAQLTQEAGETFALPEQYRTDAFDVAVDSNDTIYILDTVMNVVKIFEKKKSDE